MKKFLVIFSFILIIGIFASVCATESDYKKISNKLFSINLPKEKQDLYSIKKFKNGIYIYDKFSKKEGFGGFAFGISAYKNPKDHATMPGSRKIGELKTKKGILYDIVLIQPTDVQFNYTKTIPASYEFIYNYANNVDIEGNRGSEYFKNQGMKGENLYKEILAKHILAIKEKWDSTKLEKENMSYMYNVLAQSNKNLLDKIGYAYYDANCDGIDELFIGEIAQGNWKGVVYDAYTMVDRKPMHVLTGGTRDRYFVCDDAFLCNEYSSGAKESGMLVYTLVENSTELYPQVGFKYDGYENKNNPWFISYNFKQGEWDNVPESTYKKRKKIFDRYNRFEYLPLSSIKN